MIEVLSASWIRALAALLTINITTRKSKINFGLFIQITESQQTVERFERNVTDLMEYPHSINLCLLVHGINCLFAFRTFDDNRFLATNSLRHY